MNTEKFELICVIMVLVATIFLISAIIVIDDQNEKIRGLKLDLLIAESVAEAAEEVVSELEEDKRLLKISVKIYQGELEKAKQNLKACKEERFEPRPIFIPEG